MKCVMRNVKCVMRKSGVSLITVLLFMLVATIAATATYKWITSEGRSSASRMMEREAYQSSIAGIENTRAWMTFHANETGALIRQYIYDLSTESTDPANVKPKTTRTPINLDKHIRSFAQGSAQNHHVWLVGVSTTPPTYKVKILSEGLSRDGRARHTEVAIFNVDGLYQVEKPKVIHDADIDFDYAYFGGSYSGAGDVNVTSAIVNGNWNGNPQSVARNFIVTGNATLSGSGVNVGKMACIGGNLTTTNDGMNANEVYVGGNFSTTLKLNKDASGNGGNVYFEHDASFGSTGVEGLTSHNLYVEGNVTVNGNMRVTELQSKSSHIGGNLCVGNDGKVIASGTNYAFTVDGDVWMPGDLNLWYGDDIVGVGCICNIVEYTCAKKNIDYSVQPNVITYTDESPCTKDKIDSWEGGKQWVLVNTTITGQQSCSYGDENLVSCDEIHLGTSSTNESNYQKIILGNDANSKVYIKTAHPHHSGNSDYATLASISYTETGKKYCPTNSRFYLYRSKYNWNCPKNGGGHCTKEDADDVLVCGSLSGDETSTNDDYSGTNKEYIGYSTGWIDWSGDKPTYFPSVNSASDKYYIYNYSGSNLVTFQQGDLTGWRKFKNVGSVTQSGGYYPIPMYQSDENRFDEYFRERPDVGRYKVNSNYYYDPTTDENTFYNYANSKITGTPYCYNAGGDDGKYRPSCGVTPWFKSNGEVKSTAGVTKIECAESVRTRCMNILGETTTGCDGSSYKVNDVLATGYSNFNTYASNGCAANITTYSTSLVTELNECWNKLYNGTSTEPANRSALYNGEYLVVKVTADGNSTNPTGTLDGKFIIIVDGAVYTQLPPVEDDGYVFLYLTNGASTLNDATISNYFIYTLADIQSGLQFNMTGTIYASAATCAGIGALQTSSITYSQDVINEMTNAGIICSYTASGCSAPGAGGGTGTGTGSTSTTYGTSGKDSYFISMAPQLGVTLESQYEASEAVPTASSEDDELKKSFIVLPRIIYLTRDPDGKLSDYYNVIPLNGANVTKATASVSCSPSLNVSSNLVSGSSKLDEGLYNCNASATGYSKVPFYVWVQGTQSTSPQIYFLDPAKNLNPGEPYEVKIDVPPHSSDISVKVDVSGNTEWISATTGSGPSGSTYTYTFNYTANTSGHATQTLFTVTPPANATNGTLVFTLQTPDPNAGYQRGNPWSSSLTMATTTTLTNVAYDNSSSVSPTDIDTWCEAHSALCPEASARSSWPDCPYKTSKEWVVPDWISPAPYETMNKIWSVVTGGSNTNTLTLKEKEGSGCIVIIPSENNSYTGPINKEQTYELRAVAKAASHKIKLQFVGDVGSEKDPTVTISVGGRTIPPCSNSATNRSCTVSIFDGEKVKINIDKENNNNNVNFSYWLCKNGGGTSCPTTDPLNGTSFGGTDGFALHDDNAVVEIHFGEKDKHCFFDEFRRTRFDNTHHTCGSSGETEKETEYCIGTGTNAKWKLVATGTESYVEKDSYQGYLVASTAAPNTGVKIMSTVDAGIRGTLKALVQVPHATASYGNDSPRIKNSGFLLRSNADATSFFMLNVYENSSGYLAARLCLDGGSTCSGEVEFLKNGGRAGVTTSSMVMLSARFDKENDNVLKLYAYTESYYNSGAIGEDDYYKAEISNLGTLFGNNHASMTYQHVGLSLADRDFKVYGVGWESDDYGSMCFDGPPAVKCSFAAVAVGGVVPLGERTEPWVGHSGWFDSKDCSKEYYYYNGSDVSECSASGDYEGVYCGSDGLTFDKEKPLEAGAHGYVDSDKKDVKTVRASLSCSETDKKTRAWATTVERAHCGPFWTGEYDACKVDAGLLNSTVQASGFYLASKTEDSQNYASAKNLRGIEDLIITLTQNGKYDVDVEFWLESNSDRWGGTNYESRHGRITGNNEEITNHFRVALDGTSSYEDLSDNATGFDPEHVVAIVFKNNGDYPVTIKSAKAKCANAVEFGSCSLAMADGNGGWNITVNFNKNADKVTEVAVSSTINVTTTGPSKTVTCKNGDCFNIFVPDGDTYKNAGKEYEFSVTYQAPGLGDNGQTETCKPKIKPSAITCTPTDIDDITSGDSWPEFEFRLGNCPSTKCKYKVTLSSVNAGTFGPTGEVADGKYNQRYDAKAPDCDQDDGCSYTYTVQSTEDSHPFSCSSEFKVRKQPLADVTCGFTSVTSSASGSDLGQSIAISNPTVSCDGGGCKYAVKEGESTIKAYTDYSDGNGFSFNGSEEAGTHTYKVYMKRGSETEVECSGSYTVTYPLNLTCGTFKNPGNPTPIDANDQVYPEPPTIPSNTSAYSGCNGKCSYSVTGGSATGGSGSNYDGTSDMNPFTDADGSGDVDYTLTITGPGSTSLTCTPLTVTYTSGSSGDDVCECTCGDDCSNMRLATYSDNHNGPGMFCFYMDDEDVKLRMDTYTKEDASPNTKPHCSVTVNGTPLAKFGGTELKNLVSTKKDGGYYIYVGNDESATTNSDFCSFQFETSHTSAYNPCTPEVKPVLTACPVASATIAPGSPVVITPNTTTCNTKNGCTYTIGGDYSTSGTYRSGTIQFIDDEASNGNEKDYTLTLSVAGKGSSEPCAIGPITYNSDAETDIDFADERVHTISVGTKYKISTCRSSVKKILCTANSVYGNELWAGPAWTEMSKVFTSQSWQDLNNYQAAGGENLCQVGLKIEAKNGAVYCKNSY